MVRYILSVLIVICSFTLSAQKNKFTPPDYKKISKVLAKGSSGELYQNLMKRYQSHDTTLSPGDYHLLYYGFILQPEYSPSAHLSLTDSLLAIMSKKQIGPDQYKLVIKYAGAILDKNPFDMRYLDPLIYAYRMQGKNDLATMLEFKLGRILETIFTTGDGLTEESAFHVISVTHEYDMLRALGFGFAGVQGIRQGQYDYVKVEKNDFGIQGMYFNVSALTRAGK